MLAMPLNLDPFNRTITTLEHALAALDQPGLDAVMQDLYRSAAIRSFELSIETAGKLLRKALKAYHGNPREVDRLVYNDVLRAAGKHGLLDSAAVERWLEYRSNRNNTAHDYDEGFANLTLAMLPGFSRDARELAKTLAAHGDE
jgi:nucleotidyltransferase substrate binding protein (TIGR01987 family)